MIKHLLSFQPLQARNFLIFLLPINLYQFIDALRKERMNRELSEFPIVQDALAKKKQRQKDADREIYQVVTKDLVRKLK